MAFTLTPPLNAKARFALAATLLATALAAALTIASPALAFADDAAAGQLAPATTQSDELATSAATTTDSSIAPASIPENTITVIKPAATDDPYAITGSMEASGTTGEVNWELYSNGLLILKGNGATENIPDGGEPQWKSFRDKIISLKVEEGVTTLGDHLFINHSNLVNISLPSTLKRINIYSLYGCAFSTVKLPEGLEWIGSYSFSYNQNLVSLTIPSTVKQMAGQWIADCPKFKSAVFLPVTLPEFVPERGYSDYYAPYYNLSNIFRNAPAGQRIYVPKGASGYSSSYYSWPQAKDIGFELSDDGTLTLSGTGTLSRLDELCNALDGKVKKVVIGSGITGIGESTFANCPTIESIVLPNTLTSINAGDFAGCTSLKKLDIPASVTSIDAAALADCTNLQDVTFAGTAPAVTGGTPAQLFANAPQAAIHTSADKGGFVGESSTWPTNRTYQDNVNYIDEAGATQTKNGVRVLTDDALAADSDTLSSGWYVLGGEVNAQRRIKISGDVKLILSISELKALEGIEVPEGSTLTVYAQAADTAHAGSITAGSSGNNAAIGGNANGSAGVIVINGGKITAAGGTGAAGIGSGKDGGSANITVNKGEVTATGGTNAPGIGGGTDAKVNVSVPVVIETGAEPTRDAIGCARPEFSGSGVILVVEDAADALRNPSNPASVELRDKALMVTTGFETAGVTLTGSATIADGGSKVDLPAGSTMSFVNGNNEKVTITAPASGTEVTLNQGGAGHLGLQAGVIITVGDKGPFTLPSDDDINAVLPGKYVDATVAGNHLSASFGSAIKDFAKDVFSDEDNAKVSCGYNMYVKLEATEATNADDKALIDAKVAADNAANKDKPQIAVGTYTDLSVFWHVSTDADAALTQSNANIAIKLALAEDLLNTNAKMIRTYYIYRVHNGVVDVLPASFDLASKTLSFATDKFSTYAVAYSDAAVPQPPAISQKPTTPQIPSGAGNGNVNAGGDKPAAVTSNDAAGNGNASASDPAAGTAGATAGNTLQQAGLNLTGTSDAPATGDTAPLQPLAAAAALALIALLASATLRRRTYHK